MFVIYSQHLHLLDQHKIPKVEIHAICASHEDAKTKLVTCAKDYVHSRTESGYKLHEQDETIVITQDVITPVSYYLWTSYVTKKIDIAVFKIGKQTRSSDCISITTSSPADSVKMMNNTQLIIKQKLDKELKSALEKRREKMQEKLQE